MDILITGKNSYIGNSLENWLKQKSYINTIDKVSLKDKEWESYDFSQYDSIVHTVGIPHVDSNPSPSMKEEYYRVNRDLAIETAKKARSEGISQFIFLSSIIIYGQSNNTITINTNPNPKNFYGNSKLEAEEGIKALETDKFKVCIIRLPMVYGKGSKGNYPILSKMARLTPVFPDFPNSRSMIHIDNLTEFISLIINNQDKGVFFPQNEIYVNTSSMVYTISKEKGKPIYLTKIFNPLIRFLIPRSVLLQKVFGDFVYENDLSKYKENYNVRSFEQSIKSTEREY